MNLDDGPTYTNTCPKCHRRELRLGHHPDTEADYPPSGLHDLLTRTLDRPENDWTIRGRIYCTHGTCDYSAEIEIGGL